MVFQPCLQLSVPARVCCCWIVDREVRGSGPKSMAALSIVSFSANAKTMGGRHIQSVMRLFYHWTGYRVLIVRCENLARTTRPGPSNKLHSCRSGDEKAEKSNPQESSLNRKRQTTCNKLLASFGTEVWNEWAIPDLQICPSVFRMPWFGVGSGCLSVCPSVFPNRSIPLLRRLPGSGQHLSGHV